MLDESVIKAIEYADEHNIILPPALRIRARRIGAIKAGGDIPGINAIYHDAITQAIVAYFEGGNLTAARNIFKRAMVDAFGEAFDLGWIDGGQKFPLDDDASDWIAVKIDAEFGHIESLFDTFKEMKKEKDFDYFSFASDKADSYVRTVASVYNAGVMFAQKNKMLTWHLGATEKHCDTCLNLDGGRHRASWYAKKNYIPRTPGAAMDCGGYNCDCRLTTDSGEEVTI